MCDLLIGRGPRRARLRDGVPFPGYFRRNRARDARGRHTTPARRIPPSVGVEARLAGILTFQKLAGALMMRISLLWLVASVSLVAQQPAGRGAGPAPTYKNLKVLAATSDVPFAMAMFNEALGVQCTYCHVQ